VGISVYLEIFPLEDVLSPREGVFPFMRRYKMLKLNDPAIQELLKLSREKGGTKMIEDPNVQEILLDVTKDEENSMPIIQCLVSGKNTDEEIAEDTEIRLNIVRRILYKLYDAGVASYKRSKDPETQWYTYSWTFEGDKIAEIMVKKYEEFSQEIHQSLEYEQENMFFVCPNGCRYNFDEASEQNFTCPECDCSMEFQDNASIIMELREMKKNMS
jgi:transcription initiation factor TFIIE subunit alpha